MSATMTRPWRVLIADGRPDVRCFLATVLHGEGFETVEAANGGAALDIIRLGLVDVALLDVGLSGWAGTEAPEEARDLPLGGPLTLYTAFGRPHSAGEPARNNEGGALMKNPVAT